MKFLIFFSIFFYLMVDNTLTAPVSSVEQNKEEQSKYFGENDDENDIIFDDIRNGLVNASYRWPNNTVYYKIDAVFDAEHSSQILLAMHRIEQVSCIRFLPANETITNYVNITEEPSTGCSSNVGYRGNAQILKLKLRPIGVGCFKLGILLHELMHTLGFEHQQSAWNRDDYVKINYENIKDGLEYSFRVTKNKTFNDFGVGYDYGSILHYGPMAASKNGQNTIVPLPDENIEIGQRRDLSIGDIAKLNIMYNCTLS